MENTEVSNTFTGTLDVYPEVEGGEVVIKTAPSESSDNSDIQETGKDGTVHSCPRCRKSFARIFNLRRHTIRVHGVYYVDLNSCRGRIKCGFDADCGATFNRIVSYRQHLVHAHRIKLEKVTMNFNSLDEFLAWKAAEEHETQSRFNKVKNDYVIREGMGCIKKRSYNCCRSGKYFIKGTKKKMTMKIGTYCPAKMEILHNNEKVILTYFKTHVGHGSLDEIYVTSERKRMQGAVRRQRKIYEALKSEVKTKVVEFTENLSQNKYSTEFLKALSTKLDLIFDPRNTREDCSVETDLRSHTAKDLNAENASWVTKVEGMKPVTAVPSEHYQNYLEEHCYVCRKHTQIPLAVENRTRPLIMYNVKEKDCSQDENSNTSTNNDKAIKVILLQTSNNSNSKTTNSIVFLKQTPGDLVIKKSSPVIILKNSNDSGPLHQKLSACPVMAVEPASCNISRDGTTDSKISSSRSKKYPMGTDTCSAARQLGEIISVKHNYPASLNTEALLLKRHFDLIPDTKLQPISEEKKNVLESLWNSYKNS